MKRSRLLNSLNDRGEAKAVARRGDPETSWQAAQSVLGIRQSQAHVYETLSRYGPLIDDELIEALRARGIKMSPSGARTRRKELGDLGLVEDSDEKGKTESGRRSIKWRAVPYYKWRQAQLGKPVQMRLKAKGAI